MLDFQNDPYRNFIYVRTYSRFRDDLGRRENWGESIQRYMDFMKENLGDKLSNNEYEEIHEAILGQEVVPSMRAVWGAGDPIRKNNAIAYNCSYLSPTKWQDFGEILFLLTCGCGVGFSVESKFVEQLPKIELPKNKKPFKLEVPDNREGWANSLVFGLSKWANGEDVEFDYSKIRPKGARLKTMGGRASGHEPLKNLLEFAKEKLLSRQGYKLRPIDVHDIICKIGDIVIAGGVRRSSEISLSDLTDEEMRDAKKGAFYKNDPHRSMANNSAVYEEKPPIHIFMKEWIALMESGSGERGIFNRGGLKAQMPKRRIDASEGYLHEMGTNPCFHPDTVIETVSGRKKISEITEPTQVYTMEDDGSLGIRSASASWISKQDANVVEIQISTGKKLVVTPDHQIFIKDKGWVEAQKLETDDIVVHLSRQRRGAKYIGIKLTSEPFNSYRMEHRFVFEKGVQEIPNGYDIHHMDGNTHNNNINNLELIEHNKHSTLTRNESPNNHQVNGVDGKFISPENSMHGEKEIIDIPEELKANLVNQFPRVVSVNIAGKSDVYDISVEGTHNVIANYVVAHNCGEITLRSKQFCNLSEVVARKGDTQVSLLEKIRIATIIGTYQSTLTHFPFLSREWKKNCDEERLLGVSITGQFDCKKVRNPATLETMREYAVKINKQYAKKFGINPSNSITCVKPSGCQVGDTILSTSRGILSLNEIGDTNGDIWQSHDIGVATKLGMERSNKFFVNGYSETKKISLRSGITLESTPNHKYQVFNGKELELKSADKLSIGDCLPYKVGTYNGGDTIKLIEVKSPYWNNKKIKQPKIISRDLSWLLGLYFGDGSNHNKGIRIAGGIKDLNILEKAKDIAMSEFGISGIIYSRTQEENADLYLNSTHLIAWLGANGLLKQKTEFVEIPIKIRTSKRDVLLAFIDGYWNADGCEMKNNQKSFVTISKKMAEQLVICLRACGQDATLRLMPPTETSWGTKMRYWISTKRGRSGDYQKSPDKDIYRLLDEAKLNNLTPDFVADISNGKDFTFDIEVPVGNEYLSNGYISHNTVSQLVNASSGMHPRYAPYYIRRVRISATDPLFKMLKDQGVPFKPEVGQVIDTANTFVLEFPIKSPDGAITAGELSAIDQLEHWKMVKENYTEHNPSQTIQVGDDEWLEVGTWVYKNWDIIGGLSFLPRENHVYELAPYEKITEEEYLGLSKAMPIIDFSRLSEYEKEDNTIGSKEVACGGNGTCEIV